MPANQLKFRYFLALVSVLAFLVLISCEEQHTKDNEAPQLIETLEKNRSIWSAKGIKSYRFTVYQLVAPQEYIIDVEVKDGSITSAKDRKLGTVFVSDGDVVDDVDETIGWDNWEKWSQKYGTVDRLFEGVKKAIESRKSSTEIEQKIEYDPEFGYPSRSTVSCKDPGILDCVGGFWVKDFEVVR